jgi:hypothetical protein
VSARARGVETEELYRDLPQCRRRGYVLLPCEYLSDDVEILLRIVPAASIGPIHNPIEALGATLLTSAVASSSQCTGEAASLIDCMAHNRIHAINEQPAPAQRAIRMCAIIAKGALTSRCVGAHNPRCCGRLCLF